MLWEREKHLIPTGTGKREISYSHRDSNLSSWVIESKACSPYRFSSFGLKGFKLLKVYKCKHITYNTCYSLTHLIKKIIVKQGLLIPRAALGINRRRQTEEK
jgi:hypothetical protein